MSVVKWGDETSSPLGRYDVNGADVVGLPNGGYVLAYTGPGGASDVRIQRYNAAGEPDGSAIVDDQFQIAETVQLAVQSNGNVAVAYSAYNNDRNHIDTQSFTVYHPDGTTSGTFKAGSYTKDGAVTAFGSGYLCAYTSGFQQTQIQIALIDSDGNAEAFSGLTNTTAITVDGQPGDYETHARVASIDGGARFVVTWGSSGTSGSSYYYQIFNADGTAVGGRKALGQPQYFANLPASVVSLSGGGFVATWGDQRTPNGDMDIHAQAYDRNGVAIGSETTVNANAAGTQQSPDVVALKDGGYVFVWSDAAHGHGSEDYSILGQRFDAAGDRVGGQFKINTSNDGASGEFYPHIVELEDGRLVVQWLSRDKLDIRTQILDPRNGRVSGDDTANTLFGNDRFNDTIMAMGGDDTLVGLKGTDRLFGGAGNDALYGGAGADLLNGGAGRDTAFYLDAVAGVHASLADPSQNTGDAAGDRYVSIENLSGSAYADTLTGNAKANVIEGREGADTLSGGAAADTFVYHAGFGKDTITDFTAGRDIGHDRIQIDKSVFADYAALMAATSDSASGAIISLNATNTITLNDVTKATLTAANFTFV